MPGLGIGHEVEKEFPVSRPGEDVGDAAARESAAFLFHQCFERAAGVLRVGCGDEADFALLRQVPALGAVAAARRRRAFANVEFLPVVAQMRRMRAAGVGRHAEDGKRIDLRADHLRHFLEFDPIVAQKRIALHLFPRRAPGGHEPLGRHALREIRGQQRRVVVAKFLAEPAKPPHRALGTDAKRQYERCFAVVETADDNGRPGVPADSDMALPQGEPIERLECRAIGPLLEAPPFVLDRVEVAMDAHAERRDLAHRRSTRNLAGRRIGEPGGRQCPRAEHDIHCHDDHCNGWATFCAS